MEVKYWMEEGKKHIIGLSLAVEESKGRKGKPRSVDVRFLDSLFVLLRDHEPRDLLSFLANGDHAKL